MFFFQIASAPGCSEIAQFLFFLQNGCAGLHWQRNLASEPGCTEIAHFRFFFKLLFSSPLAGSRQRNLASAPGCTEIAHFCFFFKLQAHQVAVKLHSSFFFFKMAAPGCIGKEIWQVNQVALKLHISVFFSNCCFRRRPRAVHRTSAQFHTAMLRKNKVFTQNLQCSLLKSALLTKEVCKNSYRRGVSSLACPTVRCCMVLQAGLPPCEG